MFESLFDISRDVLWQKLAHEIDASYASGFWGDGRVLKRQRDFLPDAEFLLRVVDGSVRARVE